MSNSVYLQALFFLSVFIINHVASEPYPTQDCQIGCRGAPRAMLNDTTVNGTYFLYYNISVCAGYFAGYVGGVQATAICADNWHVCNTLDIASIISVNYNTGIRAPGTGCYAYNAANDFGLCRYCTGNIHEDDMAGFGSGCTQPGEDSCYPGPNTKNGFCCSGYITNDGCEGQVFFTAGNINGVVCCANNPEDPCFYGLCPKNCCGNGVCDTSHALCTCSAGFVGNDCCTQCTALSCSDCLNTTGCGWCSRSKTCTSLANPSCSNPITLEPQEISTCPTTPTVNVGVIVGSTLGSLALLSAIGAIFLYRRYSTGEYEGFWRNFNKFDAGLTENPLYTRKNIEVVSPLYEHK